MKKSDLYREWARVLDMCEGTNVNPYIAWKFGGIQAGGRPEFIQDPDKYEFAAGIVENRPVFVGDKLYNIHTGSEYIAKDCSSVVRSELSCATWNPPKNRRNIHDPMRWAEGLIEHLPEAHEGKITWLMRHGDGQMADDLREKYAFKKCV